MKRILSGTQPTNNLHLGNYLGAIRNWVKLQDSADYECLYCIVDLHAITAAYDAAQLVTRTREIAAAYIASGIDPAKSAIFAQSSIHEHSELMWLLATMTQMGKLSRMTQFKDKAGKNKERAGLGLFSYPVLMAADILIYQATHVPVGEDQKQHLELTREIASTFNHRYETEFFPLPEPLILGEATRVMSLRDGTQKMSKSAESDMTRINLTDDADAIAQKIKKARTDQHPVPSSEAEMEGRAEAKNLLNIYAALSDSTLEDVMARYGGGSFADFKTSLTDLTVSKMSPITSRMNELLSDPAEIDRILKEGSQQVKPLAAETLARVHEIMGFWKST